MDYSKSYKNDLIYTEKMWVEFLKSKNLDKKMIENLTVEMVRDLIFEYAPSPSSMANYKRNISSLLKGWVGVEWGYPKPKSYQAPQASTGASQTN